MDYLINKKGKEILIEGELENIKSDISSLFKSERQAQSLTQQALAKRAGMNRADVSRFESGRYNPSVELMARYAAALNCEIKIQLIPKE